MINFIIITLQEFVSVRDTVERLRRIEQQRQQQELNKSKASSIVATTVAPQSSNEGPNQQQQRRRHHSMYTKMPSNLQDMEVVKSDDNAMKLPSSTTTSNTSVSPSLTTSNIITAKNDDNNDGIGGVSVSGKDVSKDNIITLGVDSHDINDRLRQLFNDDDEFGNNTSFSQISPIPKALHGVNSSSSSNNDRNSPTNNIIISPIVKSIKGGGGDTPSTMDAKKNHSAFLVQRRGSA